MNQESNIAASSSSSHAGWLLRLSQASGLCPLTIGEHLLLPVVQGGMGVGVSAGGLAGSVAALGAWGTVSSVDLRRLHPDLLASTAGLKHAHDARECVDAANCEALRREIARALKLAGGRGLVAVNVMRAISAYASHVRTALEAGAQAIVVGAGLPLDLPDLAADFPHVALVPILSDARGVQVLVRKWERKGRLPDAIILEHPRLAGGHLGAASVSEIKDRRFDFDVAIAQTLEFFKSSGIERSIPLIAAGGISTLTDIRRLQALGASAVQLGTAFAVTQESDAPLAFKQVLAGAQPQDIVEFTSVAGLPARAVRTPWLDKYLRIEAKMQARAHAKKRCNMGFDCLQQCGLRDGKAGFGQFCIDQQLGHAIAGDTARGLFFRGAGTLPFGREIRSVVDLLHYLLGGEEIARASS